MMNRYDKRIGITPEKISENFKTDISAVIPADERVIIPSINRGVPFMLGNKGTPLAKAMLSLAETITQRINEMEKQEEEQVTATPKKFGRR